MKAVLLATLLWLFALALAAGPAAAASAAAAGPAAPTQTERAVPPDDPPPPARDRVSVHSGHTGGSLGLGATRSVTVDGAVRSRDGTLYAASGGQRGPAPTSRTELRDACTGSSAADEEGERRAPAFCGPLRAGSCDGDPTQTLYQARTVSLVDGSESAWGLVCVGARDAAGNPVAVPVFTIEQVYTAVQQEFRSITPSTGGVAVQPEGRALLNYPAIFYATQPAPATIATEGLLFGVLPFRVEGRPVRHDWLVDGGAAVVGDTHEGRPYTESERVRLSDGGVSDYYVGFTFRSSGEHEVALRTTYAGSATVAGFGTFPLPGTVSSTGPATGFEVRGARGELVR